VIMGAIFSKGKRKNFFGLKAKITLAFHVE
jgi:hypothetical protein